MPPSGAWLAADTRQLQANPATHDDANTGNVDDHQQRQVQDNRRLARAVDDRTDWHARSLSLWVTYSLCVTYRECLLNQIEQKPLLLPVAAHVWTSEPRGTATFPHSLPWSHAQALSVLIDEFNASHFKLRLRSLVSDHARYATAFGRLAVIETVD
jgi:hypothetical protein